MKEVDHALRAAGADASEDGTGRGTPLVVAAIAQNQRGELRMSAVAPSVTVGGGKPGEGYPAVLAPTLRFGGRDQGAGNSHDNTVVVCEAVAHTVREVMRSNSRPESELSQMVFSGPAIDNLGVRMLTPRECERIMDWPDVINRVSFAVCDGEPIPLKLSTVWCAANDSRPFAASADDAAVLRVEIDVGTPRVSVAIAGREYGWFASSADKPEWFDHLVQDARSAHRLVVWPVIAGHEAHRGRADVLVSEMSSEPLVNGNSVVVPSGDATVGSADDAGSARRRERFTTSEAGRSSPHSDSALTTWCCSVARVIGGFIHEPMSGTDSFACEVGIRSGWTQFGIDEKGRQYELKDSPRYQLCGNGEARAWGEWIWGRLMMLERGELPG